MTTVSGSNLRQLAIDCVRDMGDIFWDYKPERDEAMEYSDPYDVAVNSVEHSLRQFLVEFEVNRTYPNSLREEYKQIVAELPDSTDDSAIARALVARADWTMEGADELVRLARRYGTFMLRSALALAEALGIEDGGAGF